MVQRKEPETRRSQHVKLERQSSCQQQQDVLKKKMKLERSIRAADLESLQDSPPMKPKRRSPAARGSPNYMKPTSSSDAKKEQLQVTPQSKTPTNKKRSPKNSKNSNSSRTPSPLSVSLSRQSSLKAIRPLIKKSLMKGGVVVNRATCSSTLKDLRFPEALDLNPGGTEAEGTSVMRVCPYTYCSLNGHSHEPLPPLKCFVSARRKLLKIQKSMKQKGLNPMRAKVLGKDKPEIDTGQKATIKVPSCLEIAPPMEGEPDDFFIEIYTTSNPEEQVINEIVEDGVDQSREVSNEEGDVMMSFLEYVECDQQAEEAEEEKTSSLVPEENEEPGLEGKVTTFDFNWKEEGSPFPDNITERSECPDDCSGLMPPQAESSNNDEAEADTEQQQEVNQEAAEDGDAVSCCDELSKEPVPVNERTVDEVAAESKQEVFRNVDEIDDARTPDDGNFKANDSEYGDGEEFCRDDPESSEENDGRFNLCYSKENIFDTSFPGCEEGVPEEPEESNEAAHGHVKPDNNESNVLKPDSSEEQQSLLKENIKEENEKELDNLMPTVQLFNSSDKRRESDQGMTEDDRIRTQPQSVIKCDDAAEDAEQQSLLKENIKEEENEKELDNLMPTVQLFNSSDKLRESDQGMTEDDRIRTQPQSVIECDDATEDASVSSDIQCWSSNGQSDESEAGESWESENEQLEEMSALDGSIAKPKARRRATRKKTIEEPDTIREFNPRAPNFLDVEPDPEAEKVDLRHQMIDERKNAEEYLIDYALRRAVTKLAPDRKKKVALLVEAFETVMPLPVYEKPLQRAVSDFILTRMQACS